MNFFLSFLIICFLSGLLLPRVPLSRLMWGLAAGCALLAIGYFYFNRI